MTDTKPALPVLPDPDYEMCGDIRSAVEPEWSCRKAAGHSDPFHIRGNVFWMDTIPVPAQTNDVAVRRLLGELAASVVNKSGLDAAIA
jgi:hypothetical protein